MSPAHPSRSATTPHRRLPLALLPAVLVALVLAWWPAPAASGQDLVVGSTQGPAGAQVSVPISLDGIGADHLQVDVGFDGAVLTPTAVAAGPALDGHLVDWAVVAPGVLRLVVHAPSCAVVAPAPRLVRISHAE